MIRHGADESVSDDCGMYQVSSMGGWGGGGGGISHPGICRIPYP